MSVPRLKPESFQRGEYGDLVPEITLCGAVSECRHLAPVRDCETAWNGSRNARKSDDPNGCQPTCPLMRSMERAYSHQGHGPRADRTGRIHISDFRYPARSHLRNAAGPYIRVSFCLLRLKPGLPLRPQQRTFPAPIKLGHSYSATRNSCGPCSVTIT